MAPLTRQRAGEGFVLNELNAVYYAQRASAGLIISEASQISPKGRGYSNTPGIYSAEQIAGWKLVTDKVHEHNGRIYIQLWHVGRHSHPLLQDDGSLPFAPSAVAETVAITTPNGKKDAVIPHEMTKDEIAHTIDQYKQASINALLAGFDGVEIHGANGYLIDQFLNDTSNIRTDDYGGSIANKCRFALEVVKGVCEAIGSEKTGIRLSPSGTNFGVLNHQPVETFTYLIQQLNSFDLSYVHLIEPVVSSLDNLPQYLKNVTPYFRKIFNGTLITSAGYDFKTAETAIENNHADLVAFGKMYISNPDLVERYVKNAPLNPFDTSTFYGGSAEGYTDYPFMESNN